MYLFKSFLKLIFFICLSACSVINLASEDINSLKQIVKSNPSNADAVFKLAKLLSSKDQHEDAIKYWRHLAKIRKSSKTMYFYSLGLFKAAHRAEALRICDRITDGAYESKCSQMKTKVEEEYTEDFEMYTAEISLDQNNIDEAMQIVDDLISNDDENPDYRILLGKIFHKRKQYDYAMDQYQYARSIKQNNKANKWISLLKKVGLKAFDYVLNNRSNPEDTDRFYYMVYLAFKLETEDAEKRIKGFIIRAIDYYNQKVQEEESFDLYYRLGYLYTIDESKDKAKSSYQKALDNSEENMYSVIEYLVHNIDKKKDQDTYVIDLISQVGGKEVYRQLQEVAKSEDIANAKSKASELGINESEFINLEERLRNSSSNDRSKILAEFKNKHQHLQNNPIFQKYLKSDKGKKLKEKLLNSSQGKKLKEKYADQLKQFQ